MSAPIQTIKNHVAKTHKVPMRQLEGRRHHPRLVTPRHVAMYLAAKLTGASYPSLGREFDRDHTTVMHAVKKIERRISKDASFQREVEVMAAALIPQLAADRKKTGRLEELADQLSPIIIAICKALELQGWKPRQPEKWVLCAPDTTLSRTAHRVVEAHLQCEQDKYSSDEMASRKRLNTALDQLAKATGMEKIQ